ncbi:tetratricopeptide repeat protein [Thalassoglobus neptunius]|uniref:Tetratricopeptide repeat protein n=1 Tax=Thalassoglobus neptunius TaxID=1938619 RepID=A0A5C5WH33_9PLAN|nr:tetratricopeptide repeat protein [Thalassoglobus neptunius]TWT50088.1 tetratricopeptide repeat protein [Thalassoglobus neptunius]
MPETHEPADHQSPPASRRSPWISRILLLGILGAIGFGIWNSQQQTAIQQCQAALAAGDVDQARSILTKHLTTHPEDQEARMLLALSYRESDPLEAIEIWSQVPENADEYLIAQRFIAEAGFKAFNSVAAEEALETILEQDPQDFASQLTLAELYFRDRAFQLALPEVRKVISLDPDRVKSYHLLAETLAGLNRESEMVAPLQRALELDPDNYMTRSSLAYALKMSGELDEAEEHARWCLEETPTDVEVRAILAQVLRQSNRLDEAKSEVEQILQASPNHFDANLLKGELLLFERKPKEAYEVLNPLYLHYPNDRRLIAPLLKAAAMSGRTQEAARLQEALLRAIPEKE